MINSAKYFRLFFLLIPTLLFSQAEWSAPITLAQGLLPDFAIDHQTGHVHIVYHVSSQGVMYVQTDADGNILIGPELIPQTDGEGTVFRADDGNDGWDFGATIDVDQNGNPHVCYRVPKDDNYFDLKYVRRSLASWSNPLHLSSNIRRGYVIRMAIDGQNRVHVGQSKAGENIWGHIKYFRIENGVKQKDYQLTEDARQEYRADNRFEVAASDDGQVHFIMGCPGLEGESNIGPITYYRSTDGGDSFERIGDLHNRLECMSRNAAPDVSLDKAGSIHFVYGAKKDYSLGETPSLRYIRYVDDAIDIDKPITSQGELQHWNHKDYGLGSIAVSDDGEYVISAYLNYLAGNLYVRHSENGGESWSDPEELASNVGSAEGRNMHLIRAYKNNFYVIYPNNGSKPYVRMRILRHVGDLPPVADAGGPYTAMEGDSLTLNASESHDLGQNPSINLYEWDLDGDGLYEISSPDTVIKIYFDDEYASEAILQVVDEIGQTDTSHAYIAVSNVAPQVSIGGNRTIQEGDTIEVTSTVTDPGNDLISYMWTLGDGDVYNSEAITHLFQDDGLYHVTLNVDDGDGGTAQAKLYVTVQNVNPTATIEGTYEASINTPITMTGTGFDPGPQDQNNLSYFWDLDGDAIFETEGSTTTHTFDTTGVYKVWFKVMDDDGGKDSTSTEVTVTNLPPQIDTIQNQIVQEGETFSSLDLNLFVLDSDQPVDQLTWSIEGGNAMTFALDGHILSAIVPSSDWFGQDSVSISVVDPGNLTDDAWIHFIVEPVNDAPTWSGLPDFSFNEDDTLFLAFDALAGWVIDIDNEPEDFSYNFSTSPVLTLNKNDTKQRFEFIPQPNWNGKETLIITVHDHDNASAVDTCQLTIQPVGDPPNAFTIIDPLYLEYEAWPDSLVFLWEAATDPDAGDQLSYEWTLKRQGSLEPVSRQHKTLELTYTFHPDTSLEEGTYFWWINALDQTNRSKRSNREGIIIVGDPTQVGVVSAQIPTEFNLLPSYPNPFNPETTITYHMPVAGMVQLDIYNLIG